MYFPKSLIVLLAAVSSGSEKPVPTAACDDSNIELEDLNEATIEDSESEPQGKPHLSEVVSLCFAPHKWSSETDTVLGFHIR